MPSPSPKQRATTLKRQGFDDGVIGAILGLSSGDVRALLLEVDPDVSLPGVPALRTIPVTGVDLNVQVPSVFDLETWDDVLQITTPTDAAAYWFQVIVDLSSVHSNNLPQAYVWATDADGFNTWWSQGTPPIPTVECRMMGDGDGIVRSTLRETLRLPVGPGQVIGLAQAEAGSNSTVTWWDPCWIPIL